MQRNLHLLAFVDDDEEDALPRGCRRLGGTGLDSVVAGFGLASHRFAPSALAGRDSAIIAMPRAILARQQSPSHLPKPNALLHLPHNRGGNRARPPAAVPKDRVD